MWDDKGWVGIPQIRAWHVGGGKDWIRFFSFSGLLTLLTDWWEEMDGRHLHRINVTHLLAIRQRQNIESSRKTMSLRLKQQEPHGTFLKTCSSSNSTVAIYKCGIGIDTCSSTFLYQSWFFILRLNFISIEYQDQWRCLVCVLPMAIKCSWLLLSVPFYYISIFM